MNGILISEPRRAVAQRVLKQLANKPLYVLSYEAVGQQTYGPHLVDMALHYDLPAVIGAAYRAIPFGVETLDDPKFRLYKWAFDRFLQRLDQSAFRDFLAARNEYSAELAVIFINYMEVEHHLSPELIMSARSYGQALNLAAFQAANAEKKQDDRDRKKGTYAKERPVSDYKHRILIQFESALIGASSTTELLAQLSLMVGRLTGRDLQGEAALFVETVAGWPKEKLPLATELITAFMRLRKPASNRTAPDEITPDGSVPTVIDSELDTDDKKRTNAPLKRANK